MLQEHQRTLAPRALKVSIRTAVWMVMCREPMIRRPLRGCLEAYSSRTDIRPGISCSASMISLRPQSARERSATLYSRVLDEVLPADLEAGLVSMRVMDVLLIGLRRVGV